MFSAVFIIHRETNGLELRVSGMSVRLEGHWVPCELAGGSRDVVRDSFLEEFMSKSSPEKGSVLFR